MRSALALALAVLTAACGGEGPTAAGEGVAGGILVQAAASLTDAFADVATAFSEANPDATVTFNFAGSQALATQIVEGAPADVFASADSTQMDVVDEEDLVAVEPTVFATNVLAIAVEAGNPFDIAALADLADPELILVLAAPEVPAGNFAAQALEAAGVAVTPASLEVDVRSVLSKVDLGEADAGIVYASDLVSAGDTVEGVEIPEEDNLVAEYPIATLADAPNPAGAAAFVAFVLSDEGQAILEGYGFTGV